MHGGFVMTEIERAQAAIRRCEAKLAAVSDELSRYYYRCCVAGWRRWLAKLEAMGRRSAPGEGLLA